MAQYAWETINESLRRSIQDGGLPPGTRLPTEAEVARDWGVSRMTAHRAMRALQAEGLVERRPRTGTVVAQRNGLRNVAVLAYDPGQYPQVNYLQGIADALPPDCALRPFDTADSPRREAEALRSLVGRVDGIVLYATGVAENAEVLLEVASQVPLVCVDRLPDGVDVDAVVTDERSSCLEGLRLLTDAGHTRIAHFTEDILYLSSSRGRLDAYLETLARVGQLGTQWMRVFGGRGRTSFDELTDGIYGALDTMLRSPEPPTAAFCVHDHYLAATLASLDRLGNRVPSGFGLLSVNDSPRLPVLGLDRVHRIVPRTLEMGRLAVGRLAARVAEPNLPTEVVRLSSHIHPARSLAPTPTNEG